MSRLITFDTTLRDGAQSPGISFSLKDKMNIIDLLDGFGIDYIEAGNPGSVPKDEELFRLIRGKSYRSRICAFCPTCKVGSFPAKDAFIKKTLDSGAKFVSVFGKASAFHVKNVLKTSDEENLRIVRETVSFFVNAGRRVIFDAEHFFDGFSGCPEYALAVVDAAFSAGADTVVLCDTNGGTLPSVIAETVKKTRERFEGKSFGIHCHNDIGMSAAATVRAVEEGVEQIQATFLGFGERCGNADFTTILPVLAYKMGYSLNCGAGLKNLTILSRRIADIANIAFDEKRPFVGEYAFTHKAGMHVDAVSKIPGSFEIIPPEKVGNVRHIAIGELSGKAALLDKVRELEPSVDKSSPVMEKLISLIKEQESEGYYYENADESLKLMILEALGKRKRYFRLRSFKLILSEPDTKALASALIKIEVNGVEEMTAAEGNGPVNAMDKALRKALIRFYPVIETMRLVDYKVRVIDSDAATMAKVRVLIESKDNDMTLNTVGVSTDIMEASWRALNDSINYFLYAKGFEGID